MQDVKTTSQNIVNEAMKSSMKPPAVPQKGRDIRTAILDLKPLIQQALPKHLTADRLIQMATNYVRQNPAIGKCSEQSLMGAIMQASVLGLEPVQALGQCYFVPRKNNRGTKENPNWVEEVEFQIGYKGFIKLAQNTKEIKMLYAEAVYENDEFEYEKGMHQKLKHIPAEKNRGAFKGAYAVVHYNNGGVNFEYLSKEKIESRRLRNQMQRNGLKGAWATDYEAMAKGKAIKALASYMPLSADIQLAATADEKVITEKAFRNDQGGIDMDAVELDNDEWVTEYDAANVPEAQIAA